MLPQIDTDFVFFWIEDHLNMVDVKKYDNILFEMKENKVDHLTYSWWHDKGKELYSSLNSIETKNSEIVEVYLSVPKLIGSSI